MKIYLIRHGETLENIRKTYYGDIDCELTDKGIAQAEKLGRMLRKIEFDKVYCSSLKRAKDTLSSIYSGDYTVDRRINERSFGIFEGKNYKEVQKIYPEEYKRWINDWKAYVIPRGESFEVFFNRVSSFMEELSTSTYDNVLVCTHGGVMQSVYTYVLGDNLDMYWKFASRNGDLAVINYDDGFFYIDSIINMNLF